MLCMIAPVCKSSDKSTSQVPSSNTGCENVKHKKHKYECYQSRCGCGAGKSYNNFLELPQHALSSFPQTWLHLCRLPILLPRGNLVSTLLAFQYFGSYNRFVSGSIRSFLRLAVLYLRLVMLCKCLRLARAMS